MAENGDIEVKVGVKVDKASEAKAEKQVEEAAKKSAKKVTDASKKAAKEVEGTAKKAAKAVVEANEEVAASAKTLGQQIQDGLGKAASAFGGIVTEFNSVLQSSYTSVMGVLGNLGKLASGAAATAKSVGKSLAGIAKSAVMRLRPKGDGEQGAGPGKKDGAESGAAFGTGFAAAFLAKAKGLGAAMVSMFSGLARSIGAFMKGVGGPLVAIAVAAFAAFKKIASIEKGINLRRWQGEVDNVKRRFDQIDESLQNQIRNHERIKRGIDAEVDAARALNAEMLKMKSLAIERESAWAQAGAVSDAERKDAENEAAAKRAAAKREEANIAITQEQQDIDRERADTQERIRMIEDASAKYLAARNQAQTGILDKVNQYTTDSVEQRKLNGGIKGYLSESAREMFRSTFGKSINAEDADQIVHDVKQALDNALQQQVERDNTLADLKAKMAQLEGREAVAARKRYTADAEYRGETAAIEAGKVAAERSMAEQNEGRGRELASRERDEERRAFESRQRRLQAARADEIAAQKEKASMVGGTAGALAEAGLGYEEAQFATRQAQERATYEQELLAKAVDEKAAADKEELDRINAYLSKRGFAAIGSLAEADEAELSDAYKARRGDLEGRIQAQRAAVVSAQDEAYGAEKAQGAAARALERARYEREAALGAMRAETQRQGNRLTSMGLGSGGNGVEETAKNTASAARTLLTIRAAVDRIGNIANTKPLYNGTHDPLTPYEARWAK